MIGISLMLLVANLVLAVAVFEVSLLALNALGGSRISSIARMSLIFVYCCLYALFNWSMKESIPEITKGFLIGMTLVWIFILLLYLLVFFFPRQNK